MKYLFLTIFCAALCVTPASADPASGSLTLTSRREWRAIKPELYVHPTLRHGPARWMPMARLQIVPGAKSPLEIFLLHGKAKKAEPQIKFASSVPSQFVKFAIGPTF